MKGVLARVVMQVLHLYFPCLPSFLSSPPLSLPSAPLSLSYVFSLMEVAIRSYVASNKRLLAATFFHVKHRKRQPEGVHRQLVVCNRNLRSKAAVAKGVA